MRLPAPALVVGVVCAVLSAGRAAAQDAPRSGPDHRLRVTAAAVALFQRPSGSGGLLQEMVPVRAPRSADYLAVSGAALGAGILTGGVLALVGSQLGDPDAQENPLGIVGFVVLGGLGYTAGCVAGAYLVGKHRHLSASATSTIWGGVIGMVAGTAIGLAQPGDNLNGIYLPLALLAPPAGAVAGFFW